MYRPPAPRGERHGGGLSTARSVVDVVGGNCAIVQCILGGETRRLSLKNSTALPAVAAGRRRGVWWSHSVRMVGGVGGLAWVQLT